MELKEFAESILFEADLERKLAAPTSPLTDDKPGPALKKAPPAPARPAILTIPPRTKTAAKRATLPTNFDEPHTRGLILHAFANHELLALELMALAILRFPEAPISFRLGLARTIVDEQRHMRMYWQRMLALGVNLGDTAVNRFFWDCLCEMPSPLSFVTRMSLTLEQANLDFAVHYQRLFSALGDHETARILSEVHQDEIGHVKHGVIWFNRWRDSDQTEWEAYKNNLSLPLSPARAKGPIFEEDARRTAGLSEEFIENLKFFNHSKGRPPNLFWFNATWEEECLETLTCQNNQLEQASNQSGAIQKIEKDLQGLMIFLAKGDDAVWLDKKPGASHLKNLNDAGIKIPQLVCSADELGQRPFESFQPWGISPRASRFKRQLPVTFRQQFNDEHIPIYASKAWASSLAPAQDFPQRICSTLVEVQNSLFDGWSVIKAAFGSSGRNTIRIAPHGIEPQQLRWIEKSLQRYNCLIVEPWVVRIADLSIQLDLSTNKNSQLAITRFLADQRGQYLGHILNAPWLGMASTDIRHFYEQRFMEKLQSAGEAAANALRAAGYRGPAGVDAFLYRDHSGRLALRPLVEINARYTMGRVAAAIQGHLHPQASALWLHVPRRKLEWSILAKCHPAAFHDGRLIAGSLATNAPETAEVMQTFIFAGPPCGWELRSPKLDGSEHPNKSAPSWLRSVSASDIQIWTDNALNSPRCDFCAGPLVKTLKLLF